MTNATKNLAMQFLTDVQARWQIEGPVVKSITADAERAEQEFRNARRIQHRFVFNTVQRKHV